MDDDAGVRKSSRELRSYGERDIDPLIGSLMALHGFWLLFCLVLILLESGWL